MLSASDQPALYGFQIPPRPSSPLATSIKIPSDPLEFALLSTLVCSFISPPNLESRALTVLKALQENSLFLISLSLKLYCTVRQPIWISHKMLS